MAKAFLLWGTFMEVSMMDMTLLNIEKILGERLRELPLCDEDLYDSEHLDFLEEEDVITPLESAFMHGYLRED